MTRIILCQFILFLHLSLHAQDRHLRNAKDAIEENDNLKAVERLSSYFSKKGATPPYYYVKYLLERKRASSTSDHDSAFRYISLAAEGMTALEVKEQNEWCKEIGFCKNNLADELSSMDTIVFSAYAKQPTLELINGFITKYPQSNLLGQAQTIKGHLTFLDAQRINTEASYADFLFIYPDGKDAPEARQRMWELGYVAAKNVNTIASYKKFLEKYPGADLVKDAELAIMSISWEQTKSTNTIRAYEDFLRTYPAAPQQQEAKNRIWDMAWEATLRSNTKQAYLDYSRSYPASPKTEMANAFIENISWKEALASGTAASMEDFIASYPSSKNVNAAQKQLEYIEWNTAKSGFQMANVQAFLNKYPSTSFREEAEKLMEDIRSEILPYLTQNKNYRLYNVVTKSFLSDQEYEMVTILKGGLFIIQQNGKKGLINKEGKNLILTTYDCVEQLTPELFKVWLSEKYGVVDVTGEFVINLNYNSLDTLPGGGYVFSKANGEEVKYGLLDAEGKITLDAKFDGLTYINDNLYLATTKENTYLINQAGVRIGKMNFSYAYATGKERIIASIKNKYGVINFAGETVLPFNYEYITAADTGWYIAGLIGNKKAIYNRQGKEALPPSKSNVSHFNKDIFIVSKGAPGGASEKYFLYDASQKKPVTKPVYDEIMPLFEGIAAFRLNEQAGYMDAMGKTLIEPRNSDFWGPEEEVPEDYAEGEGDGDGGEEDYCYSMNPYNNYQYSFYPGYDKILAFSDSLAVLFTGGKKGYIDSKGKIVIPVIYDKAYPFMNGIANVVINNNYKIINKKGESLLDGYTINSFSADNKTALLTNKKTNNYASLDMTTMEVTELPQGLTEYLRFERYGIGRYKDVYVYIPHGGDMLVDSRTDFSEYEANKILNDAYLQFSSVNYKDAISLYEKALSFDDKKKEALLGLAKCHIALDNDSKGREYLDQLIDLQSDYAPAYEERGALYYKLQQYRQALEDYQSALEYDTYPTAFIYFRIAYCQANDDNHREAIQNYTLSINLNPGDNAAYNNRGNSYRELGELTAALKDYTSAINNAKDASDESKGMYYNNRGILFIDLKKTPEACNDFRKAVSLGNENASSNVRRYCK